MTMRDAARGSNWAMAHFAGRIFIAQLEVNVSIRTEPVVCGEWWSESLTDWCNPFTFELQGSG